MKKVSLFFLMIMSVTSLYAADPHVHGVAELDVVLNGNTLSMHFTTPLDNLVGLERAPRTEKERATVRRMAEQLRASDTLFKLTSAAQCAPASVKLEAPIIDPNLLDAPGKETATRQNKTEHKHQEDSHGTGHAELVAEFVFDCAKPDALNSLDVLLFKAFPSLHRIDVQAITSHGQSGKRLTRKASQLSF
jgi:hypothetical protein